MQRDSSNRRSELSSFLQIPPPAAFMAVGMVLPEYWVLLVLIAILAMVMMTIVQKVQQLR
jgi:hypothetical protein